MSVYPKLKQLIEPGSTIIEIGAHIGTDTKKLCETLQPANFLAIEPDQRNIEKLLEIELENITKPVDITVKGFAVGDKPGLYPFYESYGKTPHGREHTDSNSLMKPIKSRNRPGWVKFRPSLVLCRTLDSLTEHIETVDLIWMDVQGAELKVIAGATKTLSRTKYLYTECQEGRYEGQPGLDSILAALPGWEIVKEYNDNVLLRKVQ